MYYDGLNKKSEFMKESADCQIACIEFKQIKPQITHFKGSGFYESMIIRYPHYAESDCFSSGVTLVNMGLTKMANTLKIQD